MSNWLQNITKCICDELYKIAMQLQDMEDALIGANDEYYLTALQAFDANRCQEQSAIAFVAAVNTDVNRSKYHIEGLGHVCSATKILRSIIIKTSQIHDERMAAIANPHPFRVLPVTFNKWRDLLITNVLNGVGTQQQLLDQILRTGDACISNVWSSAVKLVATWEATEVVEVSLASEGMKTGTDDTSDLLHEDEQPQSENSFTSTFYVLADAVKSLLQCWAREIYNAYPTFQNTLTNFKFLSARDLFYSIRNDVDETQDGNKPITITPYTTTDRKRGLLVTIGGTDVIHYWDNNVFNALLTGEGGPDNPYMSSVGCAIQKYMDEHPVMKGVEVTFVGYSQGAMIAQNWVGLLDKAHLKTDLSRYGLHARHIVMYGSPVMGPPVKHVQYTMYVAKYDPVPLLSRYENPLLDDDLLKSLTQELARNPANLVLHLNQFIPALPKLWSAYTSVVHVDGESWEQKLSTYIDPKNQYRGRIFALDDVGSVSSNIPIIGHVLNFNNHQDYQYSDQLNAIVTTQALPNIDPQSLGPTEYFGMDAPVV